MIYRNFKIALIFLSLVLFSGCYSSVAVVEPAVNNITNNINIGDVNVNYENVIHVGKNSTGTATIDFTNISAAVNSITDSNSTNRYLIKIYPGTYEEEIVLKPYIILDGQTLGSVIIKSNNGPILNMSNSSNYVANIRFELTPTTDNAVIIEAERGGDHEFFSNEYDITSNTNGVTARFFNVDANSITLSDSGMNYNMTGSAAGTLLHDIINIQGTTDYTLLRHSIRVEVDDIDDNVAFINDISSGTTILSQVDILALITNPSYSGITAGIAHYGAGALKVDALVLINVIGPGSGSGYAFYVDSTTNNAVVEAGYGFYNTLTFANNYFLYLGTGDEFNSIYNVINAVNGSQIIGNYDYVNYNNQNPDFVSSNLEYNIDNDLNVTGEVKILDTNTGSNNGTSLCIDANNKICACGSCA